MNNNDFISDARDILDIEMSSAFKKARQILNDTAKQLEELGVNYVLKFCEHVDEDAHNNDGGLAMHIACKCSNMNVITASALLRYEQQKIINAVKDAQDN